MVYSKRRKSAKKEADSHSEPRGSESSNAIQDITEAGDNETLFDEVEDYAIIRLNPKGEIMSWNKGAEKIKGYAANEIIGKNYRLFHTAEDKEVNLSGQLLNEAKQNGRANYEGWRVRKDGNRFWGSMTLTALHNSDGTIKGYLKITRDLTERKISEDMQSNLVEELKQKNAELKKSEERYHKMVTEVVDYAIILLDKDGTILDWNKGAEKLKGYRPSEIVGKHFRLFYPKESKDAGLPDTLLKEASQKGNVVHEGWRVRKDGKRFWGSVAITALHDEEGEVIGFSKVTRDLTERKIAEDKVSNLVEELKQANARLQESEERYHQMVLEVEDYAIILLDQNGYIQNWNAGAQAIKGYTSKEIIGKSFKVFYRKEDQKQGLPDHLLSQARTVGKVNHEGWRIRKDGSEFWGNVVITALHDATGKVIGFSKVTRDLTEKKQTDDALHRTAAQLDLKNKTLERMNQELASFSHVSSHDLKEPLRKIETFANRIKDVSYNAQKSEEFVSKIIHSASRMRSLIESLLTYSQVSNEEPKRVQVNINEVVNAIKGDLEILISEKNARIRVRKLPSIVGVQHQLHQLFLNLISNALKFSKPDVDPVITLECKVIKGPDIPGKLANGDNKYYHISVKDNGIGFKDEEASRIFEPFNRLHPKNKYSGTGLGLAIVRKIVENHNGIITTESSPNAGAVFNIYLPVSGSY